MPEDLDDRIAAGTLQATTFDAQPGDALLFDARIIHGSPGNASSSGSDETADESLAAQQESSHTSSSKHASIPHRRVAIRFAGSDVQFCQYRDPSTGAITRETAIPTPDINHSLKDGDFLRKDTTTFPTLWPG